MTLKRFDKFIDEGLVKRQTPNRERVASLVEESETKREFLRVSIENIPPEEMSPNFIVDYCYDILMELIRARMFLDGFNAGSSH